MNIIENFDFNVGLVEVSTCAKFPLDDLSLRSAFCNFSGSFLLARLTPIHHFSGVASPPPCANFRTACPLPPGTGGTGVKGGVAPYELIDYIFVTDAWLLAMQQTHFLPGRSVIIPPPPRFYSLLTVFTFTIRFRDRPNPLRNSRAFFCATSDRKPLRNVLKFRIRRRRNFGSASGFSPPHTPGGAGGGANVTVYIRR